MKINKEQPESFKTYVSRTSSAVSSGGDMESQKLN